MWKRCIRILDDAREIAVLELSIRFTFQTGEYISTDARKQL